jgi:hypothetical protein
MFKEIVVTERIVAPDEEPFGNPGLDDEPDSDSPEGAGAGLSDDDMVGDAEIEGMAPLVPDADRVEGERASGWGNAELPPILFPPGDPKAGL